METFKMIRNIAIILLALGVTFLLLGFVKGKDSNTDTSNEDVVDTIDDEAFSVTSLKGIKLFVDHPVQNTIIASPLKITGKAPGNWFFEASAPVEVTNSNEDMIGQSYIMAQGEWMTTDYVPFEGTVEFTLEGDYGFLILKKDNPSGEPQFDDSAKIKVLFK